MRNVLIDTSIYIDFFRHGLQKGSFLERVLGDYSYAIHLSSVVAQELYAGAAEPAAAAQLDRLFHSFEGPGRIVTPSRSDWFECGRILFKLGEKHGFESIKRGRLVNDVLIALSCRLVDASLITNNLKDFRMIGEFVDLDIYTSPLDL